MDKITGRRAVMEVLKDNGKINKLLVAKGSAPKGIVQAARKKGISFSRVEKKVLDTYGKNNQGVVAFASPQEYTAFEDLHFTKNSFFVLLDRVQDPRNLGAIIRSCEFFGVDAVLIPKKRSAKLTKTVWKTSSGALEYMKVVLVNNMAKTIEKLREKKIWIVGADIDGESCFKKNLKGPMALVFGGEHRGMRRLVRKRCDLLVKIPGTGSIEALNVSTAAGILIYETLRQRRKLKNI
ncbi:MAG: 23S rRNA (guanosine(2251)-2'-O)-methyltransferase RlmB [Euryarchaeota archaeon]|nr:23S rRNA (guanosine(2251)-2'-O)-methyltransferase RlmB [Euryarchaeota archaeon]